jgi:hypothetical protein
VAVDGNEIAPRGGFELWHGPQRVVDCGHPRLVIPSRPTRTAIQATS